MIRRPFGDFAYFQGLCLLLVSGSVVYVGLSPLPVTVTTRIITFLVQDPYKPSFATATGRGDNPKVYPIVYDGFQKTSQVVVHHVPTSNDDWVANDGARCRFYVFFWKTVRPWEKFVCYNIGCFFLIPMNPSNKNICLIFLIYCTVFTYVYIYI